MISSSFLLLRSPPPLLSSSSSPSIPLLSGSRSRLSHGLLATSLIPSCKRTQKKSRKLDFTCFFNNTKEKTKLVSSTSTEKGSALNWPILERWDVPWQWQTVLLTMVACGTSFVLTGLVEASALSYLGFQGGDVSLDDKAEILFAGQFTVTAVVLGVVYGITNSFQPLPDDLFRYGNSGFPFTIIVLRVKASYRDLVLSGPRIPETNEQDLKQPFNLRNGWLLWGGIGLSSAIIAIALAGAALTAFNGPPQRETDALVRLLPLLGSSGISTACLVGITGVLAPVLEETVFRGFLMASLTKWFPTPVSVLISAAVFALAHLTPGEFPQLFILGTVLGLSYAQTRNLLTPITIHALWNSGVILVLTFLLLQGYDIRELFQAS